mmetsp:Transcript_4074/g.13435  ORF Transcript_4074/g.13435 Transcript_4074/m.13435 type:complete len:273 (+) Transcript_4074:1009-1827(+)
MAGLHDGPIARWLVPNQRRSAQHAGVASARVPAGLANRVRVLRHHHAPVYLRSSLVVDGARGVGHLAPARLRVVDAGWLQDVRGRRQRPVASRRGADLPRSDDTRDCGYCARHGKFGLRVAVALQRGRRARGADCRRGRHAYLGRDHCRSIRLALEANPQRLVSGSSIGARGRRGGGWDRGAAASAGRHRRSPHQPGRHKCARCVPLLVSCLRLPDLPSQWRRGGERCPHPAASARLVARRALPGLGANGGGGTPAGGGGSRRPASTGGGLR